MVVMMLIYMLFPVTAMITWLVVMVTHIVTVLGMPRISEIPCIVAVAYNLLVMTPPVA
jgi:hypothetical protein